MTRVYYKYIKLARDKLVDINKKYKDKEIEFVIVNLDSIINYYKSR